MASQKQFPPQQQGSQPGKEHAMDPRPEAILQNYKAVNKLKDKVALVTGGDLGIGRAVCLLFAAEGASVAFMYVKGHEDKDAEETLHALRDIASRTGAREPMAFPAELGYEDSCRKVVEEVASAHGGRIDVLVNNAAEQHERGSITDVNEADLDRVFRTNIFSYFLATKHAVARMGSDEDHRGEVLQPARPFKSPRLASASTSSSHFTPPHPAPSIRSSQAERRKARPVSVATPPLPAAALQRRSRVVLYYRAAAGTDAPAPWSQEEALLVKESLSEAVADHPEMACRLRRRADGSWEVKLNDTGVRLVLATAEAALDESGLFSSQKVF